MWTRVLACYFIALAVVVADPLYRDIGGSLKGVTVNIHVLKYASAVQAYLDGDDLVDFVLLFSTYECMKLQYRINTFVVNPSSGRYTLHEETFGGVWKPYNGASSVGAMPMLHRGGRFDDVFVCSFSNPLRRAINLNGSFVEDANFISLSQNVTCGDATFPYSHVGALELVRDAQPVLVYWTGTLTTKMFFMQFDTNDTATSITPITFGPVLCSRSYHTFGYADVSGDGWQDIVVVCSLPGRVYVNQRNGSLSLVSVSSFGNLRGCTPIFYDLDGDGFNDLIIAAHATAPIQRNNQNLTFSTTAFSMPLPYLLFPPRIGSLVYRNRFDNIPRLWMIGLSSVAYAPRTTLYKWNATKNSFVDENFGVAGFSNGALLYVEGKPTALEDSVIIVAANEALNDRGIVSVSFNQNGDYYISNDQVIDPVPVSFTLVQGSADFIDFDHDGCLDIFYQGESLNYYASNDIVLGDCAGGYKSDQLDTTLGTHNPAAIFAAWRSSLWTDFENDEHLELIRFFWSAPMEFLTQDPSYRLVSTGIDFISDYAVAADCDVDGDGFRDLFVAPFSHPTLVYRNMYPTSGNLSFVGFPLNGGLTFMEFASLVCVRSTDGLRDDVLVGHSSGVNFYISNGSLLEGMSSTEAFGRDFSTNRFYVAAAKCQSDITCVALIADRAYSPTLNHSLFYIRLSNGSFAYEQSVSEHALPYNADKASVRFADFDGDGNLDIVYIGVMDEFGGGDGIVFSQNYGNGSWKHLPLADVAPLTYGFSDGLIAVGQLSSALDNFTDILVTGFSDNCGVKILVRSIPAPNITTSSNSSGSTSTSAIDFVEEGSSASADIGAVLGGALGGFSFLLLFCFCCICFAALLCISCTALAVIVVAAMAVIIAVVAVAGTGLFGSLEIAAVAAVVKRRRRRSHGDDQFNWDAMMDQIEAFAAKAASVDDYVTIDWGEFRIVRKLGAGAFGEVLLAEWNDVEVALKMFRNPNDEALSEFQHEALMMSKVSHHPNIVQLIGVSFSDSSMALVLGLCKGGSLLSALQSGRLGPADKHRVAVEVCGALAFLHSLGIVHRDIAARNVLLDGSGCSKLADLGLSRVLEDKYGEQQTASTIGPVRWMAPEAISARQYSSASDAYSFGVLLWELWTNGALPYQSMASVGDVALHVIRDNMRPEIDDELVPASHAHVMRALWDTDPALRPTTLDVLRLLRESDNPTPDIRDDMRSARSGTAVSSASSVVSSQYVDASGVISA